MNNKDRWNLDTLFANDKEFYKAIENFSLAIPQIKELEYELCLQELCLKKVLDFYYQKQEQLQKFSCYAVLRLSEDLRENNSKELYAKVSYVTTQWAQASAFLFPYLSQSKEEDLEELCQSPLLENYKVVLEEILRQKAHTLSANEERLLALQRPISDSPSSIFSQLTNADFTFGSIHNTQGKEIKITHTNFAVLLEDPEHSFRKEVYKQFYNTFEQHKNGLSETLNSSLKQHWFISQARNYSSTQERILGENAIPLPVYSNLIENVRLYLPVLHEYYQLKAKSQNRETITHADIYVPFLDIPWQMSYEDAVKVICKSLEVLGKDYTSTLEQGLLNGWVDRYERPGKRSGAFSSGAYKSSPYILMNYQSSSLRDLYTLAHEAGHSMHTFLASQNNPFSCYHYAIFEAEVASTFNEQLLNIYLLENSPNLQQKAFLLAKNLDDLVATFFRQTMFSEFELEIHKQTSQGICQTPHSLKIIYSQLQRDYFGQAVSFLEESWLECLRIPHFYSPFYVYQYATGLASSFYLSKRLFKEGKADFYLNFLKRGGSSLPFDSLKLAGVDLSSAEPIKAVGELFKEKLKELKSLLRL